jgi:hypothetical protein
MIQGKLRGISMPIPEQHFIDMINPNDALDAKAIRAIDKKLVINFHRHKRIHVKIDPYRRVDLGVEQKLKFYDYHEGNGTQSQADYLNNFYHRNPGRIILAFDCEDRTNGLPKVGGDDAVLWKFISSFVDAKNKDKVRAIYCQLPDDFQPFRFELNNSLAQAFIRHLNAVLSSPSTELREIFSTPIWNNTSCILPSTLRKILAMEPDLTAPTDEAEFSAA